MKAAQVEIDGVQSFECPKSIVLREPEAAELIQIATQSRQMRGALGSPAKWPGAFYDAMAVIRQQERSDRNAQQRAMSKAS